MARRKPKKSKEEQLAENFFPVEQTNVKHAVEKEYKKPVSLEELEGKVIDPKVKPIAKARPKPEITKKGTKTKKEFEIPNITLKKKGYELIITEKPQAALKIASVLGKSTKRDSNGIPYYEVNRDGKEIVVACAVGHLFTLTQNNKKRETPVFDISWKPNYMVRKKDFTKKYHDTILKLARDAGSITIATDYDIEGEVIGLNILRFICNQKDANRMKFSTLTDKELNESYENKSKTINWPNAIAGETRHHLDWLYGINLSRALMDSIKTTGKFRIMSIGRVQGPALKLIVDKEKQIQAFKSEPYWQIFIKVKNGHEVELKHNKDISNKSELKKFENLKEKKIVLKTEKKEQTISPGVPFDLTTLQTEAYKFHGITPAKTLQAAQSLYLGGLISYPRTSSQKLPISIGYEDILEKMAKQLKVEKLITRKIPIEGKKSDPAHPSIYPTGNFQIVSGDDEKIYNLIARRFLSLFCEDAIIDNKKVKGEIENLQFSTSGSKIRKKAWMEVYPVKFEERELEDFDGEGKITDIKIEEKMTQPPKRFSPASIVSELEKKNLGTKATRSAIVETLYDRNYVKEKSIEATPLGISLIDTLNKYSPIIADEKLTRSFENEMDSIQQLKNGFEEKEKGIIGKAQETIKKITSQFKENENQIGKELLEANVQLYEQRKKENTLNPCPLCNKGNLIITYSKKTRRFFIACTAYPECKNTYSLPPGMIKKANKDCEECKFPMMIRLMAGKRPWIFCFNKECVKNKERLEKYQEQKASAQENEEKIE
ncbi:DNA topoisomerase I [Candidatus Pacearchaeota archaeon]|nr:DNA topoisomerase I [Candidatus Pacearchaeota archaeon]